MSLQYNQAPTYKAQEIRDANGRFIATDPHWLKWYLDLSALLKGLSVGSTVSGVEDAQSIIVQQVFGA